MRRSEILGKHMLKYHMANQLRSLGGLPSLDQHPRYRGLGVYPHHRHKSRWHHFVAVNIVGEILEET